MSAEIRQVRGKAARLRVDIVTLFPEMFDGPFGCSIIARAVERRLVDIAFTNPRAFGRGRHKSVDDRPYGGGSGMVLMAQPIFDALRRVRRKDSIVAYLSPRGRPFSQAVARELAQCGHLVLLCGHYEGVDERLMKHVDREISIGDYVLTGGEMAAMVVTDAVARLVPGVLPREATVRDSFADGLLEHPHYTRPATWRRHRVPRVLLSGDHGKVALWRERESWKATRSKRPDLIEAGQADGR